MDPSYTYDNTREERSHDPWFPQNLSRRETVAAHPYMTNHETRILLLRNTYHYAFGILQDFRAIVFFCEAVQADLEVRFDRPGEPLVVFPRFFDLQRDEGTC